MMNSLRELPFLWFLRCILRENTRVGNVPTETKSVANCLAATQNRALRGFLVASAEKIHPRTHVAEAQTGRVYCQHTTRKRSPGTQSAAVGACALSVRSMIPHTRIPSVARVFAQYARDYSRMSTSNTAPPPPPFLKGRHHNTTRTLFDTLINPLLPSSSKIEVNGWAC